MAADVAEIEAKPQKFDDALTAEVERLRERAGDDAMVPTGVDRDERLGDLLARLDREAAEVSEVATCATGGAASAAGGAA